VPLILAREASKGEDLRDIVKRAQDEPPSELDNNAAGAFIIPTTKVCNDALT
jgi:hypothetical protein